MTKDLTTSAIERQNILNNKIAIPRIQEALKIEAFHFDRTAICTNLLYFHL